MKRYSKKISNFFHSGMIFGGYVVIIVSVVVAIVSNTVIGILFGLLGLLIVTSREGIIINFQKKKLKNYWGSFWLRFGKWEDLPNFEKIHLEKVNKRVQAASYSGRISTFKSEKYQVRLYYSDINDYLLAYEGSQKGAVRSAKILSSGLKLKVIDKTK